MDLETGLGCMKNITLYKKKGYFLIQFEKNPFFKFEELHFRTNSNKVVVYREEQKEENKKVFYNTDRTQIEDDLDRALNENLTSVFKMDQCQYK